MRTTNWELLIFDCDGVIVDSEGISARVFAEEVLKYGYTASAETLRKELAGGNFAESKAFVERQLNKKLPDDFEQKFRQRTFEVFAEEIQPIDGIENILKRIQRPFCLASNAPRNKIDLNLRTTKLLPYFEGRIYSAYELQIWKPDPQFYLTVAKSMGFPPEKCVVIEDSKFGVRSAHSAGIRVYGYTAGESYKTEELAREGAIPFDHMGILEHILWD